VGALGSPSPACPTDRPEMPALGATCWAADGNRWEGGKHTPHTQCRGPAGLPAPSRPATSPCARRRCGPPLPRRELAVDIARRIVGAAAHLWRLGFVLFGSSHSLSCSVRYR